jgi:TrmH family RNA methyltransferase
MNLCEQMPLTSPKNPLLQSIRRAATSGRPTPEGLIVAEGPHLIEEALRGVWRIQQVFSTPGARDRHAGLLSRLDAEIVEVSARAFESLSATETTQELLALLRPKAWTWDDLLGPGALVIVLDAIQDPGNVGTIVRSAEAFGATGVVLLRGCAHVANGKLLRATAGSIFRLPFLEAAHVSDVLRQARSAGLSLYALNQLSETDLTNTDLRPPLALIVGSEGHGLSPELAGRVQQVSIPTTKVESLNAAIACSIALFEARRQRTSHEPV